MGIKYAHNRERLTPFGLLNPLASALFVRLDLRDVGLSKIRKENITQMLL